MTDKAPVFAKIMKDYLQQVSRIEAKETVAATLGISVIPDGYRIPFFCGTYSVTTDRIVDAHGKPASHAIAVLFCKYLLLCPERPSDDSCLATYKDFRDAAPYVGGFRNTVELPIANHFTNDISKLEKKGKELGGRAFATEASCDLAMQFQALPKVPVFLLFNDADEEFPAQATLLFRRNAASYLDMECLAMVGGSLAYRLQEL